MATTQVLKCPACGAIRSSFEALCPECDYEFTDIQVSDSFRKFSEKIEEYDRQILGQENKESKKGIGFLTILGWIVIFPVMMAIFVVKKVNAKNKQLSGPEKLKSEAIANFPVPNSKNDLLEFAIFVENKVKPLNYLNALSKTGMDIQRWNKVWNEKSNHIMQKAEIALSDDRNSLNKIQTSYQNTSNLLKKNEMTQWIMLGVLCALFIVLIFAL